MKEWIIPKNDADQRIDRALKKYFLFAPLSKIYQAIRTGKIRIKGKKTKQDTFLSEGDLLLYSDDFEAYRDTNPITKKLHPSIRQWKDKIHIIYEDEHTLILNKPVGLPVHAGFSSGATLLDFLSLHLGNEHTAAFVHRLDRETSGIIIAGKTSQALRYYSELLRNHAIKKVYQALVIGILSKKQGHIEFSIEKIDEIKGKVAISKTGKASSTGYRVISENNNLSLVEIILATGRMHQIRAHFAHIGHPLLGDNQYGNKAINAKYRQNGQLLHAHVLELVLYGEEKISTWTAKLPKSFEW